MTSAQDRVFYQRSPTDTHTDAMTAPIPFAIHPATGRTAIQMDDGFVYIVPAGATYHAARWESTRSHWDLYWDEVHAPQGWRLLDSQVGI